MKPLIALLTSIDEKNLVTINRDYLNAVYMSGGIGVVLPQDNIEARLDEYEEIFDGFLFCGGADIDPKYYGEEKHPETKNVCSFRDEFEYSLFHKVYPSGKPILAICRGEQVINVFLGGSLHQHIEGHSQSTSRYITEQRVFVKKDSMLYNIVGEEEIYTNSFHHQCVNLLGKGLACDAVSDDGYIEAWHSEEHPFCLGVQWHPENFYSLDASSSKIFDAFVSACRKGK